ncbi:NACHT domain-containing protein [Streptomyces violaceusniger]|uniref:Signal transduction protein with Nacht domain n=1 Tax=Streptomyces violaceusniger (strain Tu 4113) TaxID=653045 RepID=G2NSK2_STRV4|nr:NACHT domain-containing protein [Streptomyces violaceusniger]AEM80438.1 putative signal transduction protein with Nacht domain [Streptomyces violaceusniger Tu 4113]
MDPAVIGARLASGVAAPLIKKLFVKEGPGAGLVDQPVRISSLVSFRGEKRTLTEKDLDKLAAELVAQATRHAGPGERPCPADEDELVAEQLATTLYALGDLDMNDVQAVQLGHRGLARALIDATLAKGNKLFLSQGGTLLYQRLLDTACLHILHFFTQRSAFIPRTLVDQSGRLSELITKIDILIERIPSQTAQDAGFERRYAEYMIGKHSTLTIVGIDLSHAEATWPLDAAYLSLEAVSSGEERPLGAFAGEPGGSGESPAAEHTAHAALPAALPADRALSGHQRVLLRGVAGSGKTTLVQWLAVCTARQESPRGLEQLIGRVPFVLPLRTIARQASLPSPASFLASVHNPLDGAQPPGWADRVLNAGRGLLLIDGIDEIPERDRERTRAWLTDLLIAYPDNLWLVTSRPSAVADDWLGAQGFSEFTLSPMSREDMAAFIDRWHEAARQSCRTEEERAALDDYESALHTAVRTKQDLSRLATNPLMCGLICALHRARRGYLPPGRKALYDAALSMLLTRRDTERHIYAPGDVQLDEEPQIQLLQRLAYYLIRNGEAELDRDRAERLIEEALPSVPAAQALGDAPAILRHLLLRSGLLREPSVSTVDFIHRTFQDYLGAKAAVEAWDVGLLIRNAHDAQWEDVIRMAVAHARPRERAELLNKLLELARHKDGADSALRLFLLAMACLEHAPDLDPAIRDEVTRHAMGFIPPLDIPRARELATVGPLVLELLPGPEGLADEVAESCVVTASRIPVDAAIPYLAQFADHPALNVRRQLASCWGRYDTERYFADVISRLQPDGLYFVAESTEHLRLLQETGPHSKLLLRGNLTEDELRASLDPSHLTHLWMPNNNVLQDLGAVGDFPQLQELDLAGCTRVTDLTSLGDAPLRSLSCTTTPEGQILRTLDQFTSLESLTILVSGHKSLASEHQLPHISQLHIVFYESVDLDGLSHTFPGLRRLIIEGVSRHTHPIDLTPLRNLSHLELVTIGDSLTTGSEQLVGVRIRTFADARPSRDADSP